MKAFSLVIAPLFLLLSSAVAAEPEFNTLMMWNTFEILSPHGDPLGTGFLIMKPQPATSRRLKVLVTADHVFSSNSFDTLIVNARKQTEEGRWEICPVPLRIRDGKKGLWKKSPDADVAAIYCPVPDPPVTIGYELLADNAFLVHNEIHPGDTVFILGYPMGVAGSEGFPVLRTGVISSYPLTPTTRHPTINVAFTVFPGNSGGPVYIVDSNRSIHGNTLLGVTVYSVLGLVVESTARITVQEVVRNGPSEDVFEKHVTKTPLDLAVVVQASAIKKLIESLPPP